jgi:hypothetical protein
MVSHITQADLELIILLPQFSKSLDLMLILIVLSFIFI